MRDVLQVGPDFQNPMQLFYKYLKKSLRNHCWSVATFNLKPGSVSEYFKLICIALFCKASIQQSMEVHAWSPCICHPIQWDHMLLSAFLGWNLILWVYKNFWMLIRVIKELKYFTVIVLQEKKNLTKIFAFTDHQEKCPTITWDRVLESIVGQKSALYCISHLT